MQPAGAGEGDEVHPIVFRYLSADAHLFFVFKFALSYII
jgi:hypothetical protein